GVAVCAAGVDAEAVVHLAVAVVVYPVAVAIQLVAEPVRGQVRVSVVDPGVDRGHDAVAAAGRDVPGFGGIDVRIGDPAALASVVKSPESAEGWVIRSGTLGLYYPVR